jgi:hypothetical protein
MVAWGPAKSALERHALPTNALYAVLHGRSMQDAHTALSMQSCDPPHAKTVPLLKSILDHGKLSLSWDAME